MKTIIEFQETKAAERGIKALATAGEFIGRVRQLTSNTFETIEFSAEKDMSELMEQIIDTVMSAGCWKDDVYFMTA